MSGTPLWNRWKGMIDRCYNSKEGTIPHKTYRGAGVRVCKRWHEFLTFMEDMGASFNKHVEKHGLRKTTIDRIDPLGNYSLGNCRWATPQEQILNRKNTRPESVCNFVGCNKKTRMVHGFCQKHYCYQYTRRMRGHINDLQEEPYYH